MFTRYSFVLTLCALSLSAVSGCSDDPAPASDAGAQDVGAARDTGADAGTDVGTVDVLQVDIPLLTDAPLVDLGPLDAGAGDAATRDASADAAGDAGAGDAGAGCALTRGFLTTSDFSAGGYALATLSPPALMALSAMSPDQDHVPVVSGCQVFTMLRGNDVLAVLDGANLPAVTRQIPLRPAGIDGGAGPYQVNPYDVEVVAPNKAFVSQYARASLAIVDPTLSGSAAVTGSVDLSPVRASADNDPSGAPEASELLRVGNTLYVVLQNLASYAPVANGSVALVDTATNALLDADPSAPGTQAIALTVRNPVSAALAGDTLVVAGAGVQAFQPPQMLDGAIESVSLATRRPTGQRVTEAALGGDLQSIVMTGNTTGYALVYQLGDGGTRSARVVAFDLAAGTAGRTLHSGADIGAIARDPNGAIWVLDRSPTNGGVYVYREDGRALTTAPLSTGALPPYGIAFTP
ncbi:MAG: hypothetical protein JNK72_00515 [Myxococcales bacterium]|nr:hypothetical protein [Myxococcales bacterium]